MLHDGACATRLGGYALHLSPLIAGSARLVNATAGRRNYVIVIERIDVDSEDVGIVNDAVLNVAPGASTVSRLVRKIPGAGIDDIGIERIDRQRLDMDQTRCAEGRQLSPG